MAHPATLLTEKLREAAAASEPQTFRQPPHNLEAEQALLGAILVNNEALDRVLSFLSPQHFFDPLHGRIFETLAALIHAGKTATPTTVKTFFENTEPIDAHMTVPQYLGRLAANATTIINAAEYGRTVYDSATRRALIVIGEDLVNTAYDSAFDQPPEVQIEEAEGRLYGLAEQNKYGQGYSNFEGALSAAIDMANSAYQRGRHLSGASTGLSDLDNKLGGLQRSDLIILAGRPSMGKTALATNIAFNVAMAGGVVGFHSLEMSKEQLATRIVSEQTGINSEKIRRGDIDEIEFRALAEMAAELLRIPLLLDDTGGLTVAQISARARKKKRQGSLDLVVVDYLQMLAGSKKHGDVNRVQEITEITMGLKALAKELNVPILVLSQLNRQVENREDKRPQLSDLRDSGSIEQDADAVMFVFREEYYVERAKPADMSDPEFPAWQKRFAACRGKAEVIIGKHRHGPVGSVELAFDGSLCRFSNLARVP